MRQNMAININVNVRFRGVHSCFRFCPYTGVYIWHTFSLANILHCNNRILLILELNACKSSPCMNGGTCNKIAKSYVCTCNEYYKGPNCGGECFVNTNNFCKSWERHSDKMHRNIMEWTP